MVTKTRQHSSINTPKEGVTLISKEGITLVFLTTITFKTCSTERAFLVPTKLYYLVLKLVIGSKFITMIMIVSMTTLLMP